MLQLFETIPHWQHVATLCCAKNRRCDSSFVTSPLICAQFPFRQKEYSLFCEKGVFTVIVYFYLQLNKEKNAHDTTKSRLLKNEKQFKQLNRGEESMNYFDKVFFTAYKLNRFL